MDHAYREPQQVLPLGVVEVRREDGTIAGIGVASLMNERGGAINFAATSSVVPEPSDSVLRCSLGKKRTARGTASSRFQMRTGAAPPTSPAHI
ncbi:MAG: hypothetical protein R3C39_13475 [Dehalococcoidia bacterium]